MSAILSAIVSCCSVGGHVAHAGERFQADPAHQRVALVPRTAFCVERHSRDFGDDLVNFVFCSVPMIWITGPVWILDSVIHFVGPNSNFEKVLEMFFFLLGYVY